MYVTGGYATRLASCAFTFGSAILPLLTPVSYRAVFARFPSASRLKFIVGYLQLRAVYETRTVHTCIYRSNVIEPEGP